MAKFVEHTTNETVSRDLEGTSRHSLVESFLFVAFRGDAPREPVSRHTLGRVDEVQLRRGKHRQATRGDANSRRTLVLTIPDGCLSSLHATIRRKGQGFWLEDTGSKNGTWLDGRRVSSTALPDECLIEVGNTFLLFKNQVPIPRDGALDYSTESAEARDLTTLSPALGRTFQLLSEIATSTIPVLVRGETGTGKEIVSAALHRMSGRKGAFVPVNCGAIPSTLVESELFGFRKGSFSGAIEDRIGFVRAADEGTLFLDEIGDLHQGSQTTLLRVLQDRKVTPLGSVTPVNVDFRLVSATHQNLETLTDRGSFREDLFSRLNGFCVRMPPLRDRKEDIGLLVAQLLAQRPEACSVSFTPEAVRALFAHVWPENVRELARRLALATVLAKAGRIERDHLFGTEDAGDRLRPVTVSAPSNTPTALEPEDGARRDQILALLREHRGNVTAVATAMGKARAQVQRWMRRYGIDRRALTSRR